MHGAVKGRVPCTDIASRHRSSVTAQHRVGVARAPRHLALTVAAGLVDLAVALGELAAGQERLAFDADAPRAGALGGLHLLTVLRRCDIGCKPAR